MNPVIPGKETPMRVSELISGPPITIPPDTPVLEARRIMQARTIRHLLVVEDGRLVGIVTDRDIRLNMPSPATTLSVWEVNYLLARLTVREVMTTSVIVVEPDRHAHEAASLLLAEKIGALPVVDGDRLVGIVTETDFLRAFVENALVP
jgi:acetoin utilization protein AcuB